jgi:hypothetical protein
MSGMFSTVDRLQRLLEIAESEGIQIRREWMRGVRGGLVRVGSSPILFLDESLSIKEQCQAAMTALGQLDWSETEFGREMSALLRDEDGEESFEEVPEKQTWG